MSAETEQAYVLLPEDMEESCIGSMLVGDCGWTVPWAMWVDVDRKCWLHAGYTLSDRPGGTLEMAVVRESHGHVIYLPRTCEKQWSPSEKHGFVDDATFVPVAKMIRPRTLADIKEALR